MRVFWHRERSFSVKAISTGWSLKRPPTYEAPFEAIGDGGRLEARSALKAGVGLANALSYLHTNGVAHGHVGPNADPIHDGRAYLSGVELCRARRSN